MSVNQPQVRKQKLIWSSIRNRLNISLHQENNVIAVFQEIFGCIFEQVKMRWMS